MADKDFIDRIIATAATAAGPMGGQQPWQWRQRVQLLIPEIVTMFDEHSREWRRVEAILDASHFTGTYLGAELEESSTRLVVSVDAGQVDKKTGEKLIDHVRTERTDGPFGKKMERLLADIEVGDIVHCWKVNEPMRDDPQRNVRILYHIVRVKRGKEPGAVPVPESRPTTAAVGESAGTELPSPGAERVRERGHGTPHHAAAPGGGQVVPRDRDHQLHESHQRRGQPHPVADRRRAGSALIHPTTESV